MLATAAFWVKLSKRLKKQVAKVGKTYPEFSVEEQNRQKCLRNKTVLRKKGVFYLYAICTKMEKKKLRK